jgi:hypothetical protein
MHPHGQQSREQATSSPVVLVVQETTDIDLSPRGKISGVGHIGNERGRGCFIQTVLAVLTRETRSPRMPGEGHLLCALPLLMENNGTSGASGKSAQPLSGYARCTAVGRLSRQAGGCMSEIGGRIGSRSAEACQARQTPLLVRAGKSRRVEESEEEITSELPRARAFPSQASRPIEVPARHGRQARSTQL